VPGYERAELTAELKVIPPDDETHEPREALRKAAGATGLAHEAGPESVVLAGGRREVLGALLETIGAALDAGARGVEVKVEAEADAERFE
jgi:hypothetical protein